jgi:hypothetical protein
MEHRGATALKSQQSLLYETLQEGEAVRWVGFPTCTPTGNQATFLALPQGKNWRHGHWKLSMI